MNSIRPLSLFLAAATCASDVAAQCTEWSAAFGAPTQGVDQAVYALAVHDDGSGPALYAGGVFQAASGTPAPGIARWSGGSWSALGIAGGSNLPVRVLAPFDDGTGPALYAGGEFTTIGGVPVLNTAKWDGSAWSAMPVPGSGPNGHVFAFAVFDDGTGPALYAGGTFSGAAGVPALRIARWNGTSWSSLGPPGSGLEGPVHALAVFDDGTGPALYAGGTFLSAGGVPATRIARWSGTSWSSLGPPGSGIDGPVRALAVFDDGSGPALYAGGSFSAAGGAPAANLARWNGASWSALGTPGSGTSGEVRALLVHDDGSGPALYAGGSFQQAGGVSAGRIARWNGVAWSALGPAGAGTSATVHCLAIHDDGSGPALFAGGEFVLAGGTPANRVARWDGTSWSALGTPGGGLNGSVGELAVFDPGSGPELYVAGDFFSAGGVFAQFLARRTAAGWSSPGSSGATNGLVYAMTTFDDGGGNALYAGGEFTTAGGVAASRIARWDGAAWSALGSGASSRVYALAVHDDGSGQALYASGVFLSAGGVSALRVARWNGAGWSALGSGIPNNSVYTLASFDPGSGPELIAAGNFLSAGGVSVGRIARWDGVGWSALGAGVGPAGSAVYDLAVFDDGSGPALYAAGSFTTADGVPALHVARWDGASWSALGAPGSGTDGVVSDLAVHDDGSGPALYAAGDFTTAGGVGALRVARWDGVQWSSVGPAGNGPDGAVYAIASFDGSGDGAPELWLGGGFSTAGGIDSSNIARWGACAEAIVPLCFGDGSGAACPCANTGQSGRGCENSTASGGALLAASGSTTPDTLVLTQQGELPSSLSIFLQGSVELPSPAVFGDGLRCAGGSLKRLFAYNASGGNVSAPQPGDPSISDRSAALGDALAPGAVRVYQVYYRDPDLAFCPAPQGSSFNVGNALRVTW